MNGKSLECTELSETWAYQILMSLKMCDSDLAQKGN